VTTENLQYGISFPAVPEANDIMNLLVPQMMQDVMTKNKTPQQAAQDAAKKVNDMIAKRK
jgi:multiple sugar transport system substrate-binding protein